MNSSSSHEAGGADIVTALAVTVLSAIVLTGTIFYTLKRHDDGQSHRLGQQVQQANEQRAVQVSRVIAAVGANLVQADLFQVQTMIASSFGLENLVDGMLIDPDNMVVAAKETALIGKPVQDAEWTAIRAQQREVVTTKPDQTGQVRLTVVEPLKEKNEIIAWAKLTYLMPPSAAAPRPTEERFMETLRLVGPLAAWTFIALWVAMRAATASMRSRIQQVVGAVGEAAVATVGPRAQLKKAS